MDTEEKENLLTYACESVQRCFAMNPVIVLGSGHSCAFNIPGMEQLANYLNEEIPKKILPKDKTVWGKLKNEIMTVGLEAALQKVQISSELNDLIISKTWEAIFPHDRKVLEKIVSDPNYLPLSKLFRHLFNSTNLRIQLITTNYDCLAEYAADASANAWSTGFGHGYIGNRYSNQILKFHKGTIPFRVVDIWKVHGSLDWYLHKDSSVYYLPSVTVTPKEFSNVIVTPGIEKYRRTHDEPFRSVLAGADLAMEQGNSFVCVGYGFNDEHIQPKLVQRCKKDGKQVVVIVKKLTPASQKVLLNGNFKDFIVFEESSYGTKMYSQHYTSGIEIPDVNLWSLEGVLQKVI